MIDIVTKYNPEVVWSDGEWDKSDDYWKAKEFLAWLYNSRLDFTIHNLHFDFSLAVSDSVCRVLTLNISKFQIGVLLECPTHFQSGQRSSCRQ